MSLEDAVTRILRAESDRLILEARRTTRTFKSPWLTSTELEAQRLSNRNSQPPTEQTDEHHRS